MATQYPNEDFQKIYDSIYASMGDDATLKANIEAALKPLYEQSKQQLEEQRIARNADIDVDAASRGMGDSTWVTDAKLRQLRSNASALASLDASYNSQLYNALLNAQQDRDNNAYNQAMQWWQLNQQGSGGGRKKDEPLVTDNFETFIKDMVSNTAKTIGNNLSGKPLLQPTITFGGLASSGRPLTVNPVRNMVRSTAQTVSR